MNNTISKQRDKHIDKSTYSPPRYRYRLPRLPKLSLIANVNAAIMAAILTIIFTIPDQHKLAVPSSYFLYLVSFFAFGAAAAISSCFFDYKAKETYSKSVSDIVLLLGVAEIYDACALWIFITSLAIFAWGSYSTLYLLHNAFA